MANQVVKGRQGSCSTCAGGNHNLLVRHIGAVTRGKHAGHIGFALGIDFDLAKAAQVDGALEPVGVGQQANPVPRS